MRLAGKHTTRRWTAVHMGTLSGSASKYKITSVLDAPLQRNTAVSQLLRLKTH